MIKFFITLVVFCLFCCPAFGQEQGEIGSYQGCKLVNGAWTVTALFSDYLDAKEWIESQSGTSKVIDKNGLLIFGPRTKEAGAMMLPQQQIGHRFKWITNPLSANNRTLIPGGKP